MGTPSEPLLPVEPESSSRRKLVLLLGGIALAAVAGIAVLMATRRGGSPPPTEPTEAASGERAAPKATKKESTPAPAAGASDSSDEREAKRLYDDAEAFERAEPAEYEQRAARWREVVTKFPTTGWARKADEKHRSAAASLQAFLDREFESARKDAQALAAAGHFTDAIDALRTFKSGQTRDLLKRRADSEIVVLENSSRLAFNETVAKAKEVAARQGFAAAVPLFESLAASAIPEVAAKCKVALDQLEKAAAAQARHAESRKGDDARRAVREATAPKLLALVRGRQYEEALKELGAAAAGAANADVKSDVAAERASIADASAFWESFLKALRARVGQEATILLADGKRISGKVAKIQADRIVLEAGDSPIEAPLDKLHADLVVGWTVGRTLPAEDPVTYVKAALFFFCEGRDDLAKLYLATARELNGPADAAERVFREGFLRSAMPVKK